jgi:hypothetical protein
MIHLCLVMPTDDTSTYSMEQSWHVCSADLEKCISSRTWAVWCNNWKSLVGVRNGNEQIA